jgi:CcmD family protein
MTDLMGIAIVTGIIWVALFAYVFRLDRKVKDLEGDY